MKEVVFKNWNFIRFFRLVIGCVILGQAIVTQDIFIGLAGIVFSTMAIFNIGCFGGTCATPSQTNQVKNPNQDVEFEEVV
jgi:hypothetical protein